MSNDKCVLAYSGGLDTSAIVPWLIERGHEVHAVLVDVGQNEDFEAGREKALRLGARTAVVRDAKPDMFACVIPQAIALGATYEGVYRLGTALARPFIALQQVRRARELGGAVLAHGATGKGNDQVRFEFAYRSLAPEYPVLAPWKTWQFGGRQDLIAYLRSKGINDDYSVEKNYSLDENLWHLSIEGGVLEDPTAEVDVQRVLEAVADRFAQGRAADAVANSLQIEFSHGVPVRLDGRSIELPDLIAQLNRWYRDAPWAWDLVIENRFTGVKSRGLYINPAAKLLHVAVDGLSRSCLNKPTYDQYCELARDYASMLYRGEFFSQQRLVLDATAAAVTNRLNGAVTVQLDPLPYVSWLDADDGMFREDLATFEQSEFSHQDAKGFINLSWLSRIGRPFVEGGHADAMESGTDTAPDVCEDQSVPDGGLVSTTP